VPFAKHIRGARSRRVRGTGHKKHMKKILYNFGKSKGKGNTADLCLDVRT
jgi:hypothetical protein